MQTYDITNAGSNNRFTANGRVVSNSGAIVQLQNLFRNSLPDLEQARSLVKQGDYDALITLYDSLPEVLAQCVRTAFVPAPGYKFVVADFSAIEARVLAWVAGEQWVLDVFKSGGDIYCETASRMFHVPVEKHGQNAELRAKGKQATLSCIAEGQLVLTDKGLIPIEKVTIDTKLWDGKEWVTHDGVVFKGEREVITYEGLTATPDHLVFIEGQSKPIYFELAATSGARLTKTREAIQLGENGKEMEASAVNKRTAKVYDILNAGRYHRFTVSGKLVHNCGYGGGKGALISMGAIEAGMKEEELQPLVSAWRAANPKIVQLWYSVENAVKKAIKEKCTTKTNGLIFCYQGGMLYIKLPSGRQLCYVKPRMGQNRFGGESIAYYGNDFTKHWSLVETFGGKLVENCLAEGTLVITDRGLRSIEEVTTEMRVWNGLNFVRHDGVVCRGTQDVISYDGVTATPDHEVFIDSQTKVPLSKVRGRLWEGYSLLTFAGFYPEHKTGKQRVYDILNAGALHRFAVWNGERTVIVSNCVQAISRDILCHAMNLLRESRIVATVHDELIIETPMDTNVQEICDIMATVPDWAPGLILRADGYECKYYKKD